MKIFKILFILILAMFWSSDTLAQLPTPNNYIVFFDFSSRIEASNQKEKDKELLHYIIEKFKADVENLYRGGKIFSEDKIIILFYPEFNNKDNIIELTSSLSIDFSQVNFHNRLSYFKSEFPLDEAPKITTNFDNVYEIAFSQNPNYFGSNIHSFFSYSIDSYIDKEANNHVIVFTDGYMNMSGENPKRIDNKIGHLEMSILDPLRASKNWEKLYKTQNWGIISSGYELPENTTISVLELNPDCINNEMNPRTRLRPLRSCPNEFNILTNFWTDWFLDMGVKSKNINMHKSSNNLSGIKSSLSLIFRK